MAKHRIYNIMQYEKHPETGATLLTEDTIKVALAHKSCTKWAYICHDRDVYSLADQANNEKHVHGQKKGKHWHIVIQSKDGIELSSLAKWFGIPENFIDIPKGAGAFLDCVEYLTHEDDKQQELGKRRYEDEEVKANFPWRAALDKRAENKAKYGRDLDEKDQMRQNVLNYGWSLRQCQAADPVQFANDMQTLQRLRGRYLSTQQPPKTRINYYVCGNGGVGKDTLCRALARALFPDIEDDDALFFYVGANGAMFDGYDGQPVLIWSDMRAYDLLANLGGRGNVFRVFDTHPMKSSQNVKYSTVNLINRVNIVNSVQPYVEFLDGLAGEYKNKQGEVVSSEMSQKEQSYRRFPFIIPIHEEDFYIMLNRGFFENDSRLACEYYEYRHIQGNIGKLRALCGGDEQLAQQWEAKAISPATDKYQEATVLLEQDKTEQERQRINAQLEQMGFGLVIGGEPPKGFALNLDKSEGQQAAQRDRHKRATASREALAKRISDGEGQIALEDIADLFS